MERDMPGAVGNRKMGGSFAKMFPKTCFPAFPLGGVAGPFRVSKAHPCRHALRDPTCSQAEGGE